MDEELLQQTKINAQHVEALLFVEGGSLSISSICRTLEIDPAIFEQVRMTLSADLQGRGLALIQTDTELQLATNYESATKLRNIYENSINNEIGDAGLEIIAILLYRGESSRATIDYIRGVNSSTTIRNLLLRGLVERSSNKSDSREYMYRTTTQLLAHLGVTDVTHLPNYTSITTELMSHENAPGPFDKQEILHVDE